MAASQLLADYRDSLTDDASRERYLNKLKLVDCQDPYAMPKENWKDDVDL